MLHQGTEDRASSALITLSVSKRPRTISQVLIMEWLTEILPLLELTQIIYISLAKGLRIIRQPSLMDT
jgi:hypothetical protein